jgi:hypothetical protein
MKTFKLLLLASALASTSALAEPACQVAERQVFRAQSKAVLLAGGASAPADARFVLFRAPLRVNTDGAPNSYHPDDLAGATRAINNIANGVSIRDMAGKALSYKETLRVFGQFRDAGWTPPQGYRIHWQNVIAAMKQGDRLVPCVFRQGDYAGYFGSLTALKNGLPPETAGECSVADQLDERVVPALVMAGGNNPLRQFRAARGDLVVAINPANGVVQAAVIGDFGPPDNLGEGSVALNMALLKKTAQPKTYAEAKRLDTGRQEILVAIMPGSAAFQLQRPYTATNIAARAAAWADTKGYGSADGFSQLVQSCGKELNRN